MLTCALKSKRGTPISLKFYFSGMRRGSDSVEIDLTRYGEVDTSDLKDKIFKIIEGYLD